MLSPDLTKDLIKADLTKALIRVRDKVRVASTVVRVVSKSRPLEGDWKKNKDKKDIADEEGLPMPAGARGHGIT